MAAGDRTKAAGEAFLVKNNEKPGAVMLPSGSQYEILAAGTGNTSATPRFEIELVAIE